MKRKTILTTIFLLFLFLITLNFLSAWTFSGNVYNVNGTRLHNATINVTIYNMDTMEPYLTGPGNSTLSNVTGGFSFSVNNTINGLFKISVIHGVLNASNNFGGTNYVDYVGQSLPAFPYAEVQNGLSVSFYLKPAGTINITAINGSSGPDSEGRTYFRYQVKDQQLNYPVAESWNNTGVLEALLYVPNDRNYSITIYPNMSLPVSFSFNNFSDHRGYLFDQTINMANLSRYNGTTKVLNKQFNCSIGFTQITGFTNMTQNYTNLSIMNKNTLTWNEFIVIPLLIESGNVIFLDSNAAPVFNMSSWLTIATSTNKSDTFNGSSWNGYTTTRGYYNITIPAPAEGANYILFAVARNGTNSTNDVHYGGYKNVTVTYGVAPFGSNFTMHPLMGTNWGTNTSNFTMVLASNRTAKNDVGCAMRGLNLTNATGTLLSGKSISVEVKVDYSNYSGEGLYPFTFVKRISETENGNFYLPLLNITGIEEIKVFSKDYAPKRVDKMTPAQIRANPNITLNTFNPTDIAGTLTTQSIYVAIYKSNATCDVPTPPANCLLQSSASMETFRPLSSVIGGGKISFRMGSLTNRVEIHYVNVDMLASGPPDIAFESASTQVNSTAGFSAIMKFGSQGPKIYDYAIVSIPYTPAVINNQAGLYEDRDVNISIPIFYDENWNIIWNASRNGTNVGRFAANFSHYSNHMNEWAFLFNQTNCTIQQYENTFNFSNPCFINKSENKIWLRIPHFSGVSPQLSGQYYSWTATAATTSTSSTSSSSTSGGSLPSATADTVITQSVNSFESISPDTPAIVANLEKDTGLKQIEIDVSQPASGVKVSVTAYSSKPSAVSSDKQGKVYKYLQIKTENLENKLEKATITTLVTKSWVSENGLTKDKIALFKFDGNQWVELPTTFKSEDSNNYYYDSTVTSFSYFAIGEKIASVEKEPSITEKAEEIIKEVSSKAWLVVIILLALIAVIAVITGYLIRKRKKRK